MTTLRPYFSTASFVRLPVRDGFRHVAEAGYEGIEIMVTHDPGTQEAHLLQQASREFGVGVDVIHAPFLLITRRVWGTDPIGKIYRAVQVAETVGAPLVVIHPPYRWQVRFRRWVEKNLAEFSARTGVTVAVENMFPIGGERGVTFHADQELEDLDGYPYLVLDTSHAAVAGLDILDLYRRYRDKIVHVHLSNNAGKGWDSHLPVYDGVLPLDEFLQLLASDGYRGTMSIELDLRPYLEDEDALGEVLVRNREFCESNLPVQGSASRS
ncbi:MAG: sugar phosphate isomerase/epimerase family protein [Actinomycetota bacterium]